MWNLIGETQGYRWAGIAGAIVVLAAGLLAAPAMAQTTTTLDEDGSAHTVSDGFEHVTPAGPGDDPPVTLGGTITPIGPFAGEKSEGFDTQTIDDPFPTCVDDRVFNDQGDLCSSGGCAHITTGWGFACSIFPHDTPRLYGSCDGFSIYTFDMPVVQFGGYFGSNAPGGDTGATARFYDEDDVLIDTLTIDIAPNCEWTWNGWEASGAVISKVEVISSVFGGAFIQMDDMEIVFGEGDPGDGVPAASNLSLLLLVTFVLTTMYAFIVIRRRTARI